LKTSLKNVSLFSGLPDLTLDIIYSHAGVKTFPKGAIVISEGDETQSLYIVLSGKVKIYLSDDEGKEIILATHGPDEYFGELALLEDAPRSASVMTMEPCKFLVLSKTDFKECLLEYPDIALHLLKELASRVRRLTENVKSLALMDVYGRIARTLLNLAAEEGDKLVIAQQLTHQDIANRVGASREMVSRILKDLANGGYIKIENKRIVINKKLPSDW
jgi:CRP/FNR family transcriptional regulator, cyclic AMP receptor protein